MCDGYGASWLLAADRIPTDPVGSIPTRLGFWQSFKLFGRYQT